MTTIKDLVETTYDREAERYARASQMQSQNLVAMFELAAPHLRSDRALSVIDVGCGIGSALPELRAQNLFPIASYLGIDLSAEMVAAATQRYGDDRVTFRKADAETLPVENASFDCAVSNSALHWLNQPSLGSTPAKAFHEIARSLKPGGTLTASLAGLGTGRKFRAAYQSVMAEARREVRGFDPKLLLEDPVGSVSLHQCVDWMIAAGLTPLAAQLHYEPVTFESAAAYSDAVRAYGFSVFMAPLPPDRQAEYWSRVCGAFEAGRSGAYIHDQYMCYIVGRKPAGAQAEASAK